MTPARKPRRRRPPTIAALAGALTALAGVAAAPVPAPQDEPAVDPPPEAAGEEARTQEPPPSLDELIGIESEDGRAAEDVAERKAREELRRRLEQAEIGSAFEEAISKMALSADQLEKELNTGLGTQRVQEEILAKLEHLLNSARKQQGMGGGSSSSPQPRSSQQKAQPGAQRQQGTQGSQSRTGESQEGEPPPGRAAEVNTVLEEGRTEWGNLPERFREMLLQGRRETFSSLYQQLTQEYYRRLAEEGSP